MSPLHVPEEQPEPSEPEPSEPYHATYIVEPWRLDSEQSWSGQTPKKGDIQAAYSADLLSMKQAKVGKIRTPFRHAGRLWTTMGMVYPSALHVLRADCYELLPNNTGEDRPKRRFTYEDWQVEYRGQTYRLGPKTLFKTRPFKPVELVEKLRGLFADGVFRDRTAVYHQFLRAVYEIWRHQDVPGLGLAVRHELSQPNRDRKSLRKHLEASPKIEFQDDFMDALQSPTLTLNHSE